jgi:hypothetical protein
MKIQQGNGNYEKPSRNIRNENLNKSNKTHCVQYYQAEERISEMEDKIKEIFYQEKKNTYNYNMQEFCDIITRPNLRIHGVEGAKI